MNRHFRLFLSTVAVVSLSIAPSAALAASKKAAPAAATTETTLEVKNKLDNFAKMHVSRANETLSPNKKNVAVTKEKGKFVARYLEVDAGTMTTEIYPSNTPGCAYVGHIVYLEKVYECIGDSKAAASSGEFKQTRARRIRELTRYDQAKGSWIY